jgi:acetyl-CoA carboxylase carboxyl transferase subunit beta
LNWLTNIVRPKIRALVGTKEVPDNLWLKCPGCGQMLFHKDVVGNSQVCPQCNYHFRVTVKQRLESLFDSATFDRIPVPPVPLDPLKFKDKKRYSDRLKDAQAKGHQSDSVQVAFGKINGIDIVIAAFDFSFMGGSMGTAAGEAIVAGAELAVKKKCGLLVIPASGGARMQEGILSLMQMPRTVIASRRVKEAGLPYLVLLTDPTTGGVSASFAMLGDITLSEPGAVIGFAGARVIEETIRQKLPEGFQRAEYLMEHGMVDIVVPRQELRNTISRLLTILQKQRPVNMTAPSLSYMPGA